MESVGVIVGRFQIDKLHIGHEELIHYVKCNHKRVIIFLGVNPAPANRKNPLDFQTRFLMLTEYIGDCDLVLPILDVPCNEIWSKNLDEMIYAAFPDVPAILYGGRDSFIRHYQGKFPTKEVTFSSNRYLENSSQARLLTGVRPISDHHFRQGVIYALQNLMPRTYLTVDIALVKDDKVLMGRKSHDTKWRFPGGFVDFTDDSLEEAAKRELMEETQLLCEGSLENLGSVVIDDWRSSEDTRVLTNFFKAEYSFGRPEASDDLSEVEWIEIGDIENVIPCHEPLMEMLEASCKI